MNVANKPRRPVTTVILFASFLGIQQLSRAELMPGGQFDDEQTSVVYHALTGEVAVDAPTNSELTLIEITSDAGVFTGDAPHLLGDDPCACARLNTFVTRRETGETFGSFSFLDVAQPQLSEEFLLNDFSARGLLDGPVVGDGGNLGPVDFIYVAIPEPPSAALLLSGMLFWIAVWRRCSNRCLNQEG